MQANDRIKLKPASSSHSKAPAERVTCPPNDQIRLQGIRDMPSALHRSRRRKIKTSVRLPCVRSTTPSFLYQVDSRCISTRRSPHSFLFPQEHRQARGNYPSAIFTQGGASVSSREWSVLIMIQGMPRSADDRSRRLQDSILGYSLSER